MSVAVDVRTPPTTTTAADRAARARAVLSRAEERTGTSRWVRPVRPVPAVPEQSAQVSALQSDLPSDLLADLSADLSPGRPPGLPADMLPGSASPEPEATERVLPVRAGLSSLLPSGGLDRGSTMVVAGSTSLVLGLLAEASQGGAWVAVVGLPAVGVLAAHQTGLVLDRVALVPSPGADGPTVLAALLDGVEVVVVGPQVPLGDADRRRLSARARERGAVLLATTSWPGARVVLTAEQSRWEGLDHGSGRLRSRRLVVARSGRGAAGRSHRHEVLLPEQAGSRYDVLHPGVALSDVALSGAALSDVALSDAVAGGPTEDQSLVPLAGRRAG